MGHRSSRVQPFTDSEQVHDLQLPISRLKRKKKKGGDFNFFKSLSFRWKKESSKNKSSDQGEMMKDLETETSRRSTDDQKSLQSISRSVEVIDLEEPPVLDAPVRLTAGETSPLSNQVNMRPEDDICCRYAIGRKLGQGGFGSVYEGTRLVDGQKVAVKLVRKTEYTEYISIPDYPEPLPTEVALTILANKGPNKGPAMDIIRLLDWQDQQDFYVMVLERFSHCMDVFDFVQRSGGSIEEKFARLIMWTATLAADACCRRGVYHGDIKLENLLIDLKKLDVKLIDFGCGDLLSESAYTSYSGTVLYCPPEYRTKGEFHGKPATVWSLGILLFRMLCGHFPDSFDLYRTNMNTWYKPGLTEECCELICSLLQQKPDCRLDLDRIVHHKWF
ncbi:hypothetical protein R3I94_000943 [Phoxinus phoxinus]